MKRLYLSIGLLLLTKAHAQDHPPAVYYDGREYVINYSLATGTPFYKDGEHSDGNVLVYDDVTYTNVPLWYDIRLDQLVTRRPDHQTQVIVVRERVGHFFIGNEKWVYVSEKHGDAGFYKVLFESSDYKGYARYRKVMRDPKTVNERRYFEESVEYFVQTPESSSFIPIRKTNQLYTLGDKKELKSLLRTSGAESSLPVKIITVLEHLQTASN
jgi:hypothetical protein